MDILLENIGWMSFNVFLAFLGLAFGFLFLYLQKFYLKIIFFIFWLLFIPNTIYMVTDLQHFPEQFIKLEPGNQIILILQYVILFILGVVTFILGLYPLNKILSRGKSKNKSLKNILVVMVNFLIAFGVALGRVQRVNSWEVFTDPVRVTNKSLNLFAQPSSVIFILLFGLLCNCLYFLSAFWLRKGKKFFFKPIH